jgi:hypothetical protein
MSSIKRYLPEQYLTVLGKNLPAIYSALDDSVAKTEKLIQDCIDQLFLSTATGKYLVQLGQESGFTMPANSGLDIRSYRVLIPIMVAAPKQVRLSINDLIEAFYGSDRTRALLVASVPSPYQLLDGDNLEVDTENGSVNIAVSLNNIGDPNDVRSAELAAILNSGQDKFVASVHINPSTGADYVKLLSKTSDAGGYLQIKGGTLQNLLKFPNLVDTRCQSGSNWVITKDISYSELVKFTWPGTGVNPLLYNCTTGDSVTVRGIEGTELSKLNGSYILADVGYDYFVIKNSVFSSLSTNYTQVLDNEFVFTKDQKTRLFDKDEFALSSEVGQQTFTVTIPAVPPLTKRFLQGSAHLHGEYLKIMDFTRSSMQVEAENSQEIPNENSSFVIRSKIRHADFIQKRYRVTSKDLSDNPTFLLDTGNTEYSVLPYTAPYPLKNNPLFGEIGSQDFIVNFDYKHGLLHKWGFTLDGLTGTANTPPVLINKEQQVKSVVDEYNVKINILQNDGTPITFDGVQFGPCDIYRHSTLQQDGSDFYMDFGTVGNVIASGLTPGLSFKLDPIAGTNVSPISLDLRYKKMIVTSISGQFVNFSAGIGIGGNVLIIDNALGFRSGYFAGNAGTYFFDKTSTYNLNNALQDIFAVFVDKMQQVNPDYIGTYIYDPSGTTQKVTVTKSYAILDQTTLMGQTENLLKASYIDPDMPSSGQIVFGYGNIDEEGPVSYRAINRGTENQILVDPSYKFKKTHKPGEYIRHVAAAQPYVPTISGTDYPFYLTGTVAARETLFKLINMLVAAGIFVEQNVILPSLRYADPSIKPYE